jgi:site-specific DNA-methyltransferase (adenine-specific)
MTNNLYNGDCIKVMKQLISEGITVDCIITDLPYGTTPCPWDVIIPFDEMWDCINKIIKPNGAVVLFGQEPFSSLLRVSNIKNYKYDWIWKKERLTNVFQVKRRPGKIVENISVFYKKQPTYNPQKTKYDGPPRSNKIGDNARFSITQNGGSSLKPMEYVDDGTRYPLQIIECNRDSMYDTKYHPTQKPISLLENLVRTYTNEGETVLDFTMGSGSTGVACNNTNRNFIGIELNKEYFDIAKTRIEN